MGSGARNLSRFFSIFPGGWPAVGLLLLRAAIGMTAAVQGWAYFAGPDRPTFWMGAAGLLTMLSGAALIVGLSTPLVSTLIGLGAASTAFSWLRPPFANQFDTLLPAALVIVVAVAIVFLGPGALSIDARLFGFREIIIPRVPNSGDP